MGKRLLILYVITVRTFGLYAQDTAEQGMLEQLSGVLPSVIEKGIYNVTGDIFVSPGSNVSVAAGTVFLFQEFTGLHVQGTLYVKGDNVNPVVFTTKNDSLYDNMSSVHPAPFDWNGIDIYENAMGSTLSHCIVQYSVYGIRCQTEFVRLENVVFLNNGKSEFSIKDERKVIGTQPFSYFYEAPSEVSGLKLPPADNGRVAEKPRMALETTTKPLSKRGSGHFFRYAGLSMFLGGSIAGAYFTDQYFKAQKKLNDLSELDDREKFTYTSEDWIKARDNRNNKTVFTSVAGGVGCLGLALFFISFTF